MLIDFMHRPRSMCVKMADTKTFILLSLLSLVCTDSTLCVFSVEPVPVVQAEGLEAVFECMHLEANSHNWGINSNFPSDDQFPSEVIRMPATQANPARIFILATSEYNNTIIQCRAVVEEAGVPVYKLSQNATLLVQGPLKSNANLRFSADSSTNTTITISWTPPFSLNLTTAEPDIQYCVDVYNNTHHIQSDCTTETSYSYSPEHANPDALYDFKVTPRSNIPGAINGTVSEVQGYLLSEPIAVPFQKITYTTNAMLSPITWQFPLNVFSGTSHGHIPTSYFINLQSLDDQENPSHCDCPATMEVVRDNVRLTLQWCLDCDIQRHRVYNYTIRGTNNAGSSVSFPKQLSTHDVQLLEVTQVSLTVMNSTGMIITCSFLEGSTSTGLFLALQSIANKTDVHFRAVAKNEDLMSVSVGGLSKDLYSIVVYDHIDQLPEKWPAGAMLAELDKSQELDVEPLPTSVLHIPSHLLSQRNSEVCVNCSFTEAIVKGCAAVVYPTAQIHMFLGNQIRTRITNASTINCFQVNENEYAIAIFGLLQNGLESVPLVTTYVIQNKEHHPTGGTHVPSTISTNLFTVLIASGSVTSTVLVLLLFVVLIVIMSVFISKRRRKQRIQQQELELNEAYNLVNQLTANDAYNIVSTGRNNADTGQTQSVATPNHSPPHLYELPSLPMHETPVYAEIR